MKMLKQKIYDFFDAQSFYVSEWYGTDRIVREILHYPRFMLMKARLQHGWYVYDYWDQDPIYVERGNLLMLSYSRRIKDGWPRLKRGDCEVLGAPFCHYRRLRGYHQKADASGTLFFASHSHNEVKSDYSIETMTPILKALPPEFQPVKVCLHPYDYGDDLVRKPYEDAGFSVFTASKDRDGRDTNFPDKFYDILSSCRYCCGNDITSAIFYAVEMGIPFFFVGKEPRSWQIENGIRNPFPSFSDYPLGKYIFELFGTGPVTVISPEQKEFVESEIGIHDHTDFGIIRRKLIRRSILTTLKRYCIRITGKKNQVFNA